MRILCNTPFEELYKTSTACCMCINYSEQGLPGWVLFFLIILIIILFLWKAGAQWQLLFANYFLVIAF